MIKTKQVLIALAVIGANVLLNMPVHTAMAATNSVWYGDATNVSGWKATSGGIGHAPSVRSTGANLTLDGTGSYVDENSLTIPPEEISFAQVKIFYAGYSGTENVTNNVLTITGGTFESSKFIYGGYGLNGNAENNTVTISGGTFGYNLDLYGGYSQYGAVSGNLVKIENGNFNQNGSGSGTFIYGGRSEAENGMVGGDSADKGNKVVIDNAIFNSGTSNEIYGGYAYSAGGIAKYNSVTINDGTFEASGGGSIGLKVYGGYAENSGGIAKYNSVTINDGIFMNPGSGDFRLEVAGGYAAGTAQYNAVTINGGTFSASAEKNIKIIGGYSGSSDASHNTVTIKNGTFGAKTLTYGGFGEEDANATGNVVEISDGEFGDNAHIYGGYSQVGTAGGDTRESGNKVIIKKGTFNGQIYGGKSTGGSAANNSVTIDGGTFSREVIGGNGKNGAKDNEVTINDGTFTNSVYGGWSNNGGTANKNIVDISGGTFAAGYSLYGGYTTGTSSNNTLNLKIKMSGKASEVKYFQNMNFTLPSNITNGDVMLKTGTLQVDGAGGSATVNVYAADGVELNTDDVITLVDASTGSMSGNYNVGTIFGVTATEVTPGAQYSTETAKVTIDSISIKLTMLCDYFDSDSWYGTTAGGFTRKKGEAVAEGGILNIDGAGASFAETKFFYGGYSETDGIEVKNNTVNITGGEFGTDKNIYGGYSASGTANNNTVNIEGGTFDGVKLYGGYTSGTSTNNTLNLKTKMDGTAAEVKYFQNMNFTLPTDIADEDTILSTATMAFDETKITIDVNPSGEFTIAAGTVINLINASGEMTGTYSVKKIFGVAATEDSGVYSTDIAKVVKFGNVISLTMLGKYAQDVWYSIGSEKKILSSTASAQTISGAEGDVVLYHGAGENNEYGDITTTKSVTVGAETEIGKSFLISGDLTAANGVTVAAKNTLNIAAGNLKSAVANSGTVVLKEGTLVAGSTITGAGNVTIGNGTDNATVTAALTKFGNTGDLTVAANGTLVTGGELNRDIKGTGTVQLNADSTLSNGKKIDGTLDGNGKNVTIGTANSIDSFIVGKLTGTTNLTLDVDMGNFTADNIVATDFDGTVVVNGINIIKDYAEGASELALPKASTSADEITYLEKSGGNGTTSVKDGQIVVTNKYKYTFTAGGVGKLAYRVDASDLTFKRFMEGTLGSPSPTTLSLTEDLLNLGDGIASISQGPNSITINLNGHNLSSATASNITVGSGKTLNMKGGSASTDGTVDDMTGFSVAGTMNISGKTTINGNIANTGTVTFAGTTTAAGTLGGAGSYTNIGTLNIADASKLQMTGTNGLANTGILNLDGGTLGADITGDGTTNILGNVTSDKDIENKVAVVADASLTNEGTVFGPVENKGTLTNSGTLGGDLTNSSTFDNSNGTLGGKVTNSGTLTTPLEGISNWGSGNVTNSGTLNIIGGGELKGQNIVNTGTVNMEGEYTLSRDVIDNNGTGITIEGGTINVAATSKIDLGRLTKADKGRTFTLYDFADANVTGEEGSWATLNGTYTNKNCNVITSSTLKQFTITNGVITLDTVGSNFVPLDSPEDGIRTTAYHVANAMAESADGNVTNFIDGITNMTDMAAASDALNASMNIGEAGGVQHGAVSMAGLMGEAIGNNLSIIYRPILGENTRAAIRNVANEGDTKKARIEEVEVAKANEIMPVAHQEQKYEKMVWASYMHNKEDINGLQLDGVKQNGTAQYNGTTVGADLWSSNKVVGGVAIAYSTGDVNSVIGQAATKNEAKYYGVSIYNRWTNGKTGILADVGYMHSKNELTQHNTGSELTADAKINTITAGVRAEQLVKMGRSNLVPFAGIRYMHLRNGEYTLSVDGSDMQHFAPKNQNIITPQVGVAWNGEFSIPGSKWTFRPSAEVGYLWNLGDRDTESIVSFGGANDTIGYEVADKSSYYGKLGMDFRKDNVILGVSFKYQKGDAVKNRKWNFNVNFVF